MKKNFLSKYLKFKKTKLIPEIGIFIFKPNFSKNEINNFKKYLRREQLRILRGKEVLLSKSEVIALYKNIFSFSLNDFNFGISWKEETINYLTSDNSYCFLIEGEKAVSKLSRYKYFLREKYGKITNPPSLMKTKEFNEKVIRNLVHAVDEEETQNILWLLFS